MKKIATIAAAGAALLAAPLFAQEQPRANQPDPPIRANQDNVPNAQPRATLPGQPRTLPAQPGARPAQPAQPGERVIAQKPEVQDTQETDFAQQVAACLILANEAEIALTEGAVDKLQNDQARELAQTIIKDHTAFVAKLKEHAPQAANLKLNLKGAHHAAGAAASARTDEDAEANSTTNPAHANASAAERSASETLADKALRVEKAYYENKVRMINEALAKQEGQDFEQAFLGCQIAGHMSMLAKLQALENEVHDQQVAQLVKQAQETTQHHLHQAQQLMEQEKDVESDAQPRTGAAPRTDRSEGAAPRSDRPATPAPQR